MTISLPADGLILVAAALLAAGVLGAGFAGRLRVPGLLLFLVFGMVVGDDGLALLTLDDPTIAQIGGTVALVLILYEGGLTTRPGDLRRAAAPGLVLATAAVVITAFTVAGGAFLFLGVEPLTALLIGAVVASTDAAAVFTVLRRAPLPRRLSALLEVESGANDPVAIMLTIGFLEALQRTPSASEWLVFGVVQLVGGVAVGAVIGLAGSAVLSRTDLGAAGLYPVLALAVAGLAYGISAAVGASGFLAVYVAGLLVGARVPRHRRDIRTFHDGLANAAEIGLFLLLGILVFPSELPAVALPALAITAVLILVARPLAVFVCLPWFGFGVRELAFTSWAGLRGAVPIVLATFPLSAGHPQGALIFNIVFFVVLVSATLQGISIGVVAGWLGLGEGQRPWAPIAESVPLEEAEAELVEVDIAADLHVSGRTLAEVPPPGGALVTAIVRGRRVVMPKGGTRLQPGDLLLVAMPRQPDAAGRLTAWARGEDGSASAAPGPAGDGGAPREGRSASARRRR